MKPFAEREIRAILLLIVIVLVSSGVWLIKRSHPGLFQKKPQQVITPSEKLPPNITVHVVGAVNRPSLYTMPRGSRVIDAIEAAGGVTEQADLTLLNQAGVLTDGRQVRVPSKITPQIGTVSSPSEDSPVHLNTATAAQLEQIPGIGPVTAKRIIEYRDTNGGFTSVDELVEVRGIGPKTLERLRPYLAVY